MEDTEALKWGVLYVAWSVVITVVAGVIATAGIAVGGLIPLGVYALTPEWLRVAVFPWTGLGLIVLGVLVWWTGNILAFYQTFVGALEVRIAGQFDTETMKSDVLRVIDDRLSDIHYETTQTRQVVDRIGREEAAAEFEFQDDFEP